MQTARSQESHTKSPVGLREFWPDIGALIAPRRKTFLLGLVLILISRAAGFVLPASLKYLVDDVIGEGRVELLTPIVLAVLAATFIAAATSFSLTQLLSKSAQQLIADMRRKVQAHVGRLPVAYYDSHQTGTLVSRIMSDVEGLRNLVGTGLVNLLGGLLTAVVALAVLLYISVSMTLMALTMAIVFTVGLRYAFKTLRPAFRERRKIHGEVTGRLTESLGGVRVIKGYHAEEREAQVFSGGVQRLLENVFRTLTGTALVSVAATVLLGAMSALIMWVGSQKIFAGELSLGDFVSFTAFSAMLLAPLFQIVNIGTQLMEAFAGLERTREVLNERSEHDDPRRTIELGTIRGDLRFEDMSFSYEAGKEVLHGVSFEARPGTVTALVGPSGSGKSTIIGLVAAFHAPEAGRFGWTASTYRPFVSPPTARSSESFCRIHFFSTDRFARTWLSRGPMRPKSEFSKRAASPASTSSRKAFPTVMTRSSASAGSSSRAGNASASPSRAQCSPTRAS